VCCNGVNDVWKGMWVTLV